MSRSVKEKLERAFPSLRNSYWKKTSNEDPSYNCIAYAGGDQSQRWDVVQAQYRPAPYWPPGVAKDMQPETLVKVFESLGYELCENASHEEGFHKVALYSKDGKWTHAAKQLPDKGWSSKLGDGEDIRHDSLTAVAGKHYGDVYRFMRRALPAASPAKSKAAKQAKGS
ncbi:MAG: DUF7689 domain-containing protein [Steroidobacteraceae bacterium]